MIVAQLIFDVFILMYYRLAGKPNSALYIPLVIQFLKSNELTSTTNFRAIAMVGCKLQGILHITIKERSVGLTSPTLNEVDSFWLD